MSSLVKCAECGKLRDESFMSANTLLCYCRYCIDKMPSDAYLYRKTVSCDVCGRIRAIDYMDYHTGEVNLCRSCFPTFRWGTDSATIEQYQLLTNNECYDLVDKLLIDWILNPDNHKTELKTKILEVIVKYNPLLLNSAYQHVIYASVAEEISKHKQVTARNVALFINKSRTYSSIYAYSSTTEIGVNGVKPGMVKRINMLLTEHNQYGGNNG